MLLYILFIVFLNLGASIAMITAPASISITKTSIPCHTTLSSISIPSITEVAVTQVVLHPATSAIITLGPNEFTLHDPRRKRQRCFNDQGFSVDCATWTGYYYTWGPPGDPYEGGPGEGGGGSGGSEPGTTIISYAGGAAAIRIYSLAGLVFAIVAFFL